MSYPSGTPSWRRYLNFWRRDVRGDVGDELRFHFEMRIDDLVSQGMSPDDALARALDEFGDVTAVEHGLRDIDRRVARRRSRTEWLDGLQHDIVYSVRSLRRAPGFSLAILTALALGLGVNAVMFSFLDTVFVRPPAAVVSPNDVHRVWWEIHFTSGRQFWPGFSYPQYTAVASAVQERARTAVYRVPATETAANGQTTMDARVSYAESRYFPLLGVRAALGRLYMPDEDRFESPTRVALISMRYWQRALGADSAVIGKSLAIGGRPFTIVGVLPDGFTGADLDATDVWLPFAAQPAAGDGQPWWTSDRRNGFSVLVRPLPSTSSGELENRISAALSKPDINQGRVPSAEKAIIRLGSINQASGPGKRAQEVQIATRLAGVTIIVFVIACANVVNLLLARAVRRRREIGVRLALGISRARLVRLLVTESAVLAAGAALVSLPAASWAASLLRSLLLPDVHWAVAPFDWRVVLLAIVVAIGAGCIAGLIPALQAASPDLTHALKTGGAEGGVQRSRLRGALVIVQSALSVVLLVGALLFVRSLSNVRGLDIGYDANRLLIANVRLPASIKYTDPSLPGRFSEISARIAQMGGVEKVAQSSMPPMAGFSFIPFFTETDSLGSRKNFFPTVTAVSAGYFATIGSRLVDGSDFPENAAPDARQTVIVNEAMARVLWPGVSAIGRCIRFEKRTGPCYRVIGVAATGRRDKVIEDPQPQYYLPLAQLPEGSGLSTGVLTIRASAGALASISRELRMFLSQAIPGATVKTMMLNDYIEPQYRPWRLGAELFASFGILALIVAAIGIYSTVTYGVSQRMKEFGVRIALGARVADVLALVIGDGVRVVVLGVACGLALALASGRLIASLLYGVEPTDPIVMALVAVTLLGVAVIAALVPASRAARVDPVAALRAE